MVSEEQETVMCDGAMMFSLSRVTSPYLYPCLVQYSLLAAAVLVTMWTRASREHQLVTSREAGTRMGTPGPGTLTSACSARIPDCNGSHGGLFCGVLVVVFTIVSLILTFVLVTSDAGDHPDLSEYTHSLPLSDLVKFLSCLVIYLVATVAVLLGMCQMR